MDVDVTYEGLTLMRGATLTTTPNGPFIGLSAPMPVGTNLVLKREGASCAVRVARVEEGASAGIFIAPIESLDRLMPGAGNQFAPPEPPPAPAVDAEEAAMAPTAAAGPAEALQAQDGAGASEPEVMQAAPEPASPERAAAATAEATPVSEATTAPATAAAEPAAIAPVAERVPAEATAEAAVGAAAEAAPPAAPPASEAPAVPEIETGAVAQVMDPTIVTAPVATADILEEMPAGNTGPVQAPKKSESDGDASKKGRRRGGTRGGKKR